MQVDVLDSRDMKVWAEHNGRKLRCKIMRLDVSFWLI
jgi:hypothetical protein